MFSPLDHKMIHFIYCRLHKHLLRLMCHRCNDQTPRKMTIPDSGQSMRHYVTKLGTWRRSTSLKEAFGTEPIFELARHDIMTTGRLLLAPMVLNKAIYYPHPILNKTGIYWVLNPSDHFLSRLKSCIFSTIFCFSTVVDPKMKIYSPWSVSKPLSVYFCS